MGALFRSEKMVLCQMFIQPEAAYQAIAALGEAGIMQFKDLNLGVNAFSRQFVLEVHRSNEMEIKLQYIMTEILKEKITIPKHTVYPLAPSIREIVDLESRLEKLESEIFETSRNFVNLKHNFLELTEFKQLLVNTHTLFQEQKHGMSDSLSKVLIENDKQQIFNGHLGFITGIIPRERVPALERMLWRISRGNVFLRQVELLEPLEDPDNGTMIWKTAFVAFFQGEHLRSLVTKVCAAFHATLYACPSTLAERQEMFKEIKARLNDLSFILNQTKDHRHRVLLTEAQNICNWNVIVCKMKATYQILNMFNVDVTKKCLIGECWVPVKDLSIVQKTLANDIITGGSSIIFNVIESTEDPPTFNHTNRFTQGFQNLIDAYGIAKYREVNPALYTIITFPFLFAIMFGDVGHGLILTAFGAYMVISESRLIKKKIKNEIWNIFFEGRYIIFLMGIFSIYTGIIYNDVFSKMTNVFGSSWKVNYNVSEYMNNKDITLDPRFEYVQKPYPVGLDPVWQDAANKIVFMNSYKMKLSIIFGVIHMMFGVSLSIINYAHFQVPINIYLNFLPELIFLTFLFFYMVIMILIKWIIYAPLNDLKTSARCAPSVLIIFINMLLFKSGSPFEGCDEFMFPFQKVIQTLLVIFSLLCIPVMLFGKPIYCLYFVRRKKNKNVITYNGQISSNGHLLEEIDLQSTASTAQNNLEVQRESEESTEIFIYQAIHTVEYILSTVSHTASYLRLWALSLAHTQLSEVLWNMVLRKGLQCESYIGAIVLYFVFGIWALFTLAILVMMEGLSAFLHTLRLHWVEFMSKFYKGDGYIFHPFSFKHILEAQHKET